MGRTATLSPLYLQSKKLWYISIPPRLSKTGKRSQEYFQTKKEAENRSSSLKKIDKHYKSLAHKVSPELMKDAVELDELAQFYGFSGLREAFLTWSTEHDRKNASISFGELLTAYEADHVENWSERYFTSRWKPFHRKVIELEAESIATMNSDFWREWLSELRKRNEPAPATYNQFVSMLKTLFTHEKARNAHEFNPIETIPRLKDIRAEVCISPPQEVNNILQWCLKNDPDLIPYFALGYFAGLRPLAELMTMTFEQINLSDRIIDCITTKTHRNPRRQIPIADNSYQWLKIFEKRKGSIIPTNFRRRYRKAKTETSISWGHDIMRHSYGSYYEAQHRSEAGCRESIIYNMGHTSFKTYEQKYRNGKITPDEAKAYWSILPKDQN